MKPVTVWAKDCEPVPGRDCPDDEELRAIARHPTNIALNRAFLALSNGTRPESEAGRAPRDARGRVREEIRSDRASEEAFEAQIRRDEARATRIENN